MTHWSDKYTNTRANITALAGMKTSAMSILNGKICLHDARDKVMSKKVISDTWVFDMEASHKAVTVAASGGKPDDVKGLEDSSYSELYRDILQQHKREMKRIESVSSDPRKVIMGKHNPLAAAGNLIQTGYETIRKINDLKRVSGRSYLPERFQARNAVGIESTGDLNFRGFVQNELLEGQPDIGDNDVPDPVKVVLTSFEKSLLADSFRWDIGNREKVDSAISIVDRFARQIPGIMEKMVNDKILAKINAVTSGEDVEDWDDRPTNADRFTFDAAEDVENSLNDIEDFDGSKVMISPRSAIRLYKRNSQGLNVTTAESGQSNRSGTLPFHEDVTYYIDNAMTDNTFAIIAKEHYATLWEGPKINVTARNDLTPNKEEINILFHFNAVEEKVTDAISKKNGYR